MPSNGPLNDPRSILITGASSGIGAALARAYAKPGVTLHLGGRDAQRLGAVADACRSAGAIAEMRVLDVTDRAGMAAWIGNSFAAGPVDLVIANAGISGGTGAPEGGGKGGEPQAPSEDQTQVEKIFAVNVAGVINTIYPAIACMRKQEMRGKTGGGGRGGFRGQIAIMSSLAGFRGLPGAPAYGASKAAVRSLGEGLRGICGAHGIRVSVICPGFIRTTMTDINPYPMPFLMAVGRAAAIIVKGLAKDRARIAFPWQLWALVWLMAALPVGLTDLLFRRMPEKPASN